MHPNNCTITSDFVIIGFSNLYGFNGPVFCVLLITYSVTCLQNILIIFLVISSVRLHTPMYLILSTLSLCDILYVTNFAPKMLHDILVEKATFSVIGCIAQLNIYGTTGNTRSMTNALMSFDRYLAISNPLRYSALMSNKLTLCLIGGIFFFAFTCVSIESFILGQLEFCGPKVINHVYCDFSPFVELSFSDTRLVKSFSSIMTMQLILFPLILMFLTYAFILNIVLKIPSASGRKKTFSTCSSHFTVVSVHFIIFISIYGVPEITNSAHMNKGLSFIFLTITPLVNPIIYTLKNHDIRRVLETKIRKLKDF